MDVCCIDLKPLSWIQTVATGNSAIAPAGQSLIMRCAPVADSNLELSNGATVQGLIVVLSISIALNPGGVMERCSKGGLASFSTTKAAHVELLRRTSVAGSA